MFYHHLALINNFIFKGSLEVATSFRARVHSLLMCYVITFYIDVISTKHNTSDSIILYAQRIHILLNIDLTQNTIAIHHKKTPHTIQEMHVQLNLTKSNTNRN
jgi:hypothetical protein